jgi:hypothetical protein
LEHAELTGANLCQANLSHAYMYGARLSEANLTYSRLVGTVLRWANLQAADLRGALMTHTDFRNAGLGLAQLQDTHLRLADLSGANLSRTDLSRADLRSACLHTYGMYHAILTDARLPDFQLPEGDLIGWGIKENVLVKMLVPAAARRTAVLINRNCRAEYVRVLEVHNEQHEVRTKWWDTDVWTVYRAGACTYSSEYDDSITTDNAPGIHFVCTREEAEGDYYSPYGGQQEGIHE